jgi:hypothetical protein
MQTLAERSLRVAMTGIIPVDDPTIIADMQSELDELERLLRNWAAISKGLNLTKFNAEIRDYDDELASLLVKTAEDTLKWRDRPR